jgi:hypothetical protein
MDVSGISPWTRRAALLAINLLFLMVWGFTGFSKVAEGKPAWFADKFGATLLAKFPGLTATFWLLTISELAAFVLALVALLRLEFLERRPAACLAAMLAWSLFVFLQLGLGQWITNEFTGAQQLFMYFAGTLVTLQFTFTGRGMETKP